MFLEPEDTPIVKANALENSIAVKQTVIEDRNLRVRFGIKFSVDVDFRVLNACGRAGADLSIAGSTTASSSRLVSFRFVYHQSVSWFS